MNREEKKRKKIIELTAEYFKEFHNNAEFKPGKDYINYAGRVFDHNEGESLINSALDFWLTAGKYSKEIELKIAQYLGVRKSMLTNSGSSANLLAMSALTSDKLGDKKLSKGDEVITVAAGFPTTVNPIYQNGLVPVYCDIEVNTKNIKVSDLEMAISSKSKAIILAHSLGNPYDLDAIIDFAQENNLWVIEDNCDALVSRWDG